MKTFKLSLLSFVTVFSTAHAENAYIGKTKDNGIVISIVPVSNSSKIGDKLLIKGTIKAIGKDYDEKVAKKGLLELFDKRDYEISATFPSSASDVSDRLTLRSVSRSEIEFSFLTPDLSTEDLNQFAVRVFNEHGVKEKLDRLARIQAKIQKAIQQLQALKRKYDDGKNNKNAIAIFEKEIDKLQKLIAKISEKISSNERMLADNTLSLQVDNITSSTSSASSVIGKFRYAVEIIPGTLIEGMSTTIKTRVVYAGEANVTFNEKSPDKYRVDSEFNGIVINSKNFSPPDKSISYSFDYSTNRLKASDSNKIALHFYDSQKKNPKLLTSFVYQLAVNQDQVKPAWLAESVPNTVDRYTKNLRSVNLIALDQFGRIDPQTFKSTISGQTVAGQSYSRDISTFLSATRIGDGWSYSWFGNVNPLDEGDYTIKSEVRDLKGNLSDVYSVNFGIDRTKPQVFIGVSEGRLTNQYSLPIPILVNDRSPTLTSVYVNEQLFFSTGSKDFTATVTLGLEGLNNIKVISTDDAGNISETAQVNVKRDTTPPIIAFVAPKESDAVDGFYFMVSCNTNEPVINAKLNGQAISFGNGVSEVMTFEKSYSTVEEGNTVLTVEASDKAGNIGSASITVYAVSRPLNQSLIGLYLDEVNQKVIVKGAVGATRPNYQVKVSGGFFNSKTIQASSRGAFEVSMDPSTEYSVSVYDERKSKTVTFNYVLGGDNDVILSGVVRDTNDFPLVNARVNIIGTNYNAVTDSNGVFSLLRSTYPNAKISGDQKLLVDGTTAVISPESTPHKFSKTVVSITIGIKQSNILQTPIYLAPTFLDGSSTEINVASGGEVTSEHAPGVSLYIPAEATEFPDGATVDKISLQTIPAEFSTIPPVPEAMPKTVVALEPSGTTFSEPVELTLPNVNSFPPNTEMVIMLMNSKTGRWEIGGAAVVSGDGQSVVTKPDQGIRHFSLAYATIAGPNIRQVGAQDRPGADTFNGAVSTKIELPSFRALGKSYAPSLVYKSTWAKPSVVVTNLLDFPNKKVTLTPEKNYGSKVVKYTMDLVSCTYPATGFSVWCNKYPTDFYTNVQYETNYTDITSEVQPEKVVANLKSGALSTQPYEFNDLPHMANISFAVDLKDSNNSYFSSGLYPYQAHYDIHFKELIMGTAQTKYWTDTTDAKTESPEQFTQEYSRLFAQDLTESIYVQNYRNSAAGRGWRIGGVQKVLNPSGNKVVIEEADGAIASYSIKNTIQTIFDLKNRDGNVSGGVALNAWPSIAVAGNENNNVIGLTYNGESVSSSTLGSGYSVTGTLAGYDFYNYTTQSCYEDRYCSRRESIPFGNVCVEYSYRTICNNVPASYCSKSTKSYTLKATPSQMILLNGGVIGVDSTRHAVFGINGSSSQQLLGVTSNAQVFANNYQSTAASHIGNLNQYCSSTSGLSCGAIATTTNTYGSYNACGTAPNSVGMMPVKGDSVVNGTQSLNTPMGIVASPWPDIVVIADTGNHKVRWLNVATKETGIIAGNGTAMDLGDGAAATSASLKHPQGLAYDRTGNLYISTQSGYIRKVDTNGNITTFAGDPIAGKLTNETQAAEALFNKPYGLVIDQEKNLLYVADTGNNRVVRIDILSGVASTVAGTGSSSSSGDGGSALDAGISAPSILGLDTNGNLLITDAGANSIRRVIFQTTTLGTLAFTPTTDDHSELKKDADGTWTRTYRNGTKVYFDQKGRQYAEQDRVGRTVNYSYDSKDRLVKVTLPTGQAITYNYSGETLDSIVDTSGRTTSFSYSWNGDLKKVTYPDNSSQSYEYDEDGLLMTEIDQSGAKTHYIYNAQSRISKVIAPDSSESIINDSASTDLANYDSSKSNKPKSQGQATDSIQDANGNVTEVAKDFQGYISTIIDAKGNKTLVKRNAKGLPTEVIDPLNNVVRNTYNAYGDMIGMEDVSSGIIEQKAYDSWGNIVHEVNGNGQTFERVFDPASGLLQSETSPNGMIVSYEYNHLGLATKKVVTGQNGDVQSTLYSYDNLGNLTKQTQDDGKSSSFEYDLAGNVIKITSQVGSSGSAITLYTYDAFNRLVSVTSPKGEQTAYTYSPFGDLIEVKDPKNGRTAFEYDNRRRLIKKIESSGGVFTFQYDNIGNVVKETDPKGQSRQYSYDALNNVIKAQFSDDVIDYVYNEKNEIVQVSNSNSVVTYVKDSRNRVIESLTSGKGQMSGYPSLPLAHTYDNNGNRVLVSSAIGSIGYSYDSLNLLVAIQNSWGDVFSFEYDGIGRLKAMTRPSGRTDYSYLGDTVANIIHSSGGITKSFVEYTYDERNYPVSKRSPAGQLAYSYDSNGQLTGSAGIGSAETFTYDALGNRSQDHNGYYTYDSSSQRLLEDWQYKYSYDANGNLTQKTPKDSSKNAYVYSYSSKNQLIQVLTLESPLGQVVKQVDYTYDVLGRRLQKSVWDHENQNDPKKTFTRKYVYDGDNILAEYDGNNTLLARYTHSPLMPDDILSSDISSEGVTAGVGKKAGKYFYLKDTLGSVTDIIDENGFILQRYDYDVFGKIRTITDGAGVDIGSSPVIKTSFAFTGREWDEEADLYYYRARYYDPSIGRFLQKDPAPGQLNDPGSFVNAYSYVQNRPTIATDPSGKFIFLIAFALSLAGSGAMSATVAAITVGALGALASVELTKYGGNTKEMLNKESGWSLAGIAAFGALGGWFANYIGATIKGLSFMKNLRYSNLTNWIPNTVAYGVGSATGSTITTAGLDATNIMKPQPGDYQNGFALGLIFGGTVGASNYLLRTNFAYPVGVFSEGAYFYTTNAVPEGNKQK